MLFLPGVHLPGHAHRVRKRQAKADAKMLKKKGLATPPPDERTKDGPGTMGGSPPPAGGGTVEDKQSLKKQAQCTHPRTKNVGGRLICRKCGKDIGKASL
jgi:hypothetical protein